MTISRKQFIERHVAAMSRSIKSRLLDMRREAEKNNMDVEGITNVVMVAIMPPVVSSIITSIEKMNLDRGNSGGISLAQQAIMESSKIGAELVKEAIGDGRHPIDAVLDALARANDPDDHEVN